MPERHIGRLEQLLVLFPLRGFRVGGAEYIDREATPSGLWLGVLHHVIRYFLEDSERDLIRFHQKYFLQIPTSLVCLLLWPPKCPSQA